MNGVAAPPARIVRACVACACTCSPHDCAQYTAPVAQRTSIRTAR